MLLPGIQEMQVYGVAGTGGTGGGGTGGGTGDCSSAPQYQVTVLSPAPGSTITGTTPIVVCAVGMKNIWARSWHQPDASHTSVNGYDARFANAVPDATGKATLSFPAASYPRGPIAILVDAWDSVEGDNTYTHTDTAYIQAVNTAGVTWNRGNSGAPVGAAGKSLVYLDDFTGPLSISRTGAGATYASAKPDGPNGTEFGDAVFGDYNGPYNPFSVVDGQYLRIRSAKLPAGQTDPLGYGRQYYGGLLSSARTDGTGYAVQYGYFEAKMLAPNGKGGWPAFWLMSKNQLPVGSGTPDSAEIDTVELYTHDSTGACQSNHWWGVNPETHATHCNSPFTFGSNASTWHRYGVNVTPTDTIYYIDDVEVWRQPTTPQAKTPMYFMVNLALGGGWPVDLSRTGNQIDLFVDYIRVYA